MISGTYLVHILPTHVLPVFADPDSEVKEVELQKKKKKKLVKLTSIGQFDQNWT